MAPTKTKDDAGVHDVEKQADVEREQGFRGVKVDPIPNEEYSLESGPDGPEGTGRTRYDAGQLAQD